MFWFVFLAASVLVLLFYRFEGLVCVDLLQILDCDLDSL